MERSNGKILTAILQSDFPAFVDRAFREVEPRSKLVFEDYILFAAQTLAGVAGRSTRRLIINMPPRHLKSLLTSVFLPAWILGRDPRSRIIIISHQMDLAERFSRQIRQIMSGRGSERLFQGRILATTAIPQLISKPILVAVCAHHRSKRA
jgi:hypothetical protein